MLTVRIATQSRGIVLLCAKRLYKVIRLIVQKSKMASFRRTFFPPPRTLVNITPFAEQTQVHRKILLTLIDIANREEIIKDEYKRFRKGNKGLFSRRHIPILPFLGCSTRTLRWLTQPSLLFSCVENPCQIASLFAVGSFKFQFPNILPHLPTRPRTPTRTRWDLHTKLKWRALFLCFYVGREKTT